MDKESLAAGSPLPWIVLNNMVNENQKTLEFKDHRFLIDIYNDNSPDIVCRKSAQVGWSVAAIMKSFWLCKYKNANVIYVLPTQNLMKDFVTPKVNPLITSNKAVQDLIASDRENLKQVGNRFLYFKGAASEREAIAITGDVLVLDEYDRMPDMNIVNTYDSRLQASDIGWRWRFSNPSQIGFGVDGLYNDSDQMHWFITCKACNHRSYIDWDIDEQFKNHHIDISRESYVCGKCNAVLPDSSRRNGEWVAKYPDRPRRGYWISQLMAPWVSAKRIIEQHNESTKDFFYNFVLGKAYTPTDIIVNRETILRACAPSLIPRVNVVIGVDQNVSEQIWVAGTPQGIFAHGRTKSWEELERLKLMWNAVVVSDPMPYPTMPKQLATKYRDFYMCRFKNFDGMNSYEFKGQIVYADRTRLLDIVANEITSAKLLFRESPHALEDYIADWNNIYRATEETPDGKVKSTWFKKENKESDFSFATAYFRLGLTQVMNTGGHADFAEPLTNSLPKADYVNEQGELVSDINTLVEQAYDAQQQIDWLHS